jgi:hypothetical protein
MKVGLRGRGVNNRPHARASFACRFCSMSA